MAHITYSRVPHDQLSWCKECRNIRDIQEAVTGCSYYLELVSNTPCALYSPSLHLRTVSMRGLLYIRSGHSIYPSIRATWTRDWGSSRCPKWLETCWKHCDRQILISQLMRKSCHAGCFRYYGDDRSTTEVISSSSYEDWPKLGWHVTTTRPGPCQLAMNLSWTKLGWHAWIFTQR